MAEKANKDRQIEDRLRAHIRARMTKLEWTVTRTADEIDHDQGNLSRILLGDRGISAALAFRISRALGVSLDDLFNKDPARQFWEYYVPRPNPAQASPGTVQAARRTSPGAGHQQKAR